MQISSVGNSNSVMNDILGLILGAQDYHFCIYTYAYVRL